MTSISRQPERIVIPWTAVRAQPLQHLEVPAVRRRRARLVPRAAVRVRPLQHLEVPTQCRIRGRTLSNFRRPCRCRCFSVLKYPSHTASNISILFTGCPVAATASRIARLTARSRARSVGSLILPRTSATTTSSERPGMALCVSGWIASVAASVRFSLPVRASTPGVALEDIVEGVTRRVSLWLVFSWALRSRALIFYYTKPLLRRFSSRRPTLLSPEPRHSTATSSTLHAL